MPIFNETMHPTSFGFFDSDPAFQSDADKIINFVLRKLGEDVLSVELTKKQIWTCFEEATLYFNAIMIEYQAKSNLSYLLGTPTGSIDPATGKYQLNLVNSYVQPNLEYLVRQAEPYASEVGYGQSLQSYSGSIKLEMGRQDYDLYTELRDEAGNLLSSYMGTGSLDVRGRMKVFEVYHFAPIQYVFNSNLASNFIATGLPVESYIPDTRFYVLPLFEDVLRASMLDTASRVRRSHYSYKITGTSLRIFPTPNNLIPFFNDKLWIRVGFPSSALPGVIGTYFSGSIEAAGSLQNPATPSSVIFGVNSPANLPMGFISYSSLNPWSRNWIILYTLALCKELLGLIRSKMKQIPIPGAELQLNGEDLIQQGREDKKDLLAGDTGIITKLDALTYDKLSEMAATKAENEMKQLQYLPMPPRYNIGIF
jgi:hypothetical protein